MTATRIRLVLAAAAAAAAVVTYGMFGHTLPQLDSHDAMPGAAAGLCLLLVTALGYVALGKREVERRALVVNAALGYVPPAPRPPFDGRARASPSVLQRFRN
jgi:hypothetical protein